MLDNLFLNTLGLSNIQLRQYQIDGVKWFLDCISNKHGGILADEMGLGKTIQTISAILCFRNMNYNKFIIISPLSVINNWEKEFTEFAPNLSFLIYMGSKEKRFSIRNSDHWKSDNIILITTYEYLLQDFHEISIIKFNIFFMDEGHRIKNDASLLHEKVREMSCEFRFLLTGTPIQNNLDELYNLLKIVIPDNSVHSVSRENFKKNLQLKLSLLSNDVSDFQGIYQSDPLLSKLILRRIKAEVLQCLPEKVEILIFHGLTNLQKQLYKSILMKKSILLIKPTDNFSDVNVTNKQLLNILMQIRKCVLHPYLFNGIEKEPFELGEHLIEHSAKLQALDQLLQYLIPLGHKILIFSQMTKMLDIIQDYCSLRGFNYERLDGSVRSEERWAAITNFNANDSTSLFLLSTRAGGQGLNLTAADTVVFVDSDFNPQVDLQAMARIHRPGQIRPCRTIRLVAKHSVEEMIIFRSQQKLHVTRGVLGHENKKNDENHMNINEIVCYGLDKIFCENDVDSGHPALSNEFLTSILGDTDDKGHWQPLKNEMKPYINENVNNIGHIYVFEGMDYKPQTSKKDYQTIDEIKKSSIDVAALSKSKGCGTSAGNKKKSSKQRKNESKPNQRKKEMWEENDYLSCNIQFSEDDEEMAESNNGRNSPNDSDIVIKYVIGDVTNPIGNVDQLKIICHLVDNTGSWGTGGLFTAIDRTDPNISINYLKASEMEDLKLGDCHLFNFKPQVKVALLVAQTRDKNGFISPINLKYLESGFSKVRKYAIENKASIHMARLGYKTHKFNWYGIEKLIEKNFTKQNLETFVYYFRRASKRTHNDATNKKLTELYWKSILTDVVIYFDSSVKEKWKNILISHVYSLNGSVKNDPINSEITHYLFNGPSDIMDSEGRLDGIYYLKMNWLIECIKKKLRISEIDFKI